MGGVSLMPPIKKNVRSDSKKGTLVSDPFSYLEKDHKKIGSLLNKLTAKALKKEKRGELFLELQDELTLHAEMEEKIMYPILERLSRTHTIVQEAFEEHHVVKHLLNELTLMPFDTEEWMAKLTVLKENIEHHVEEEESDMFKKARTALSASEKEALAVDMENFLMEWVGV